MAADSTGQRNGLAEPLSRRLEAKGLPRPLVAALGTKRSIPGGAIGFDRPISGSSAVPSELATHRRWRPSEPGSDRADRLTFGHGARDLFSLGQPQCRGVANSRRRPNATAPRQDPLDRRVGAIKAERSDEASSLASTAPTSRPSGPLCNRCASSSATLLLLTQRSVCCIDRLNPPPKADMPCDVLEAETGCVGSVASRSEQPPPC